MSERNGKKAGDALASVLGGAAGPLDTDAGRALLLALVRLHELGVLTFATDSAAVHSPRPNGQPGAVVGCGEAKPSQTVPAYNMGQSNCIDGADHG